MLHSPPTLIYLVKDTCYKSHDYSVFSSLLVILPTFKHTEHAETTQVG